MASYPFYRASAAQAREFGLSPNLPQANIGLWFTRFYDGFQAPTWAIDKDSKRGFIDATVQLAGRHSQHSKNSVVKLAERQQALCEALGGQCRALRTATPLLTGSGLSHPVENGFTFHPTLGVPYLPASGVKGLLRGWIEAWADLADDERQRRVAEWFGTAKGSDDAGSDAQDQAQDQAGSLIFFDALPLNWATLRCDILTPHMGKWYENGGEMTRETFATAAPGDWHSPVPSPFLVADRGAAFLFCIAPRCTGDAQHDAWAQAAAGEAMQALLSALEWIGLGAKTAAGYGAMEPDPDSSRRMAQRQEDLEKQRQEAERKKDKDKMSPADKAMADLFDARTDKNQDERSVLFIALKAGKLSEYRQEAAQRLKTLMQEQKRWKEKTEKKNPDKDQPYQDTLLVMKWLGSV